MWEPYMWTHGWFFPLMGFAICLGFFMLMFRFAAAGRGFGCMGGHDRRGAAEADELRREVGALREEMNQLKASR